tara:strand:- start:5220 stop:5984 length:765 start_codon:yes stop_codon:yes gene_type:complete
MSDDPQNDDTSNPFSSDQEDKGTQATFTKEDLEKVLKQNINGQNHIKTLESETAEYKQQIAELQQQLEASKSLEEMMADLRDNEPTSPTGPTATQVDKASLLEELKSEVFAELTSQQQKDLQDKNWQQSVEALTAAHGDKYDVYVAERAGELDMSVDQLADLAKSSPKAFLDLVGVKSGGVIAPTTPSTRTLNLDTGPDLESDIRKTASLKKDLDTPEGRDANRKWKDPDWQRKMREEILEKAKKEGSQFGNRL